VVRHEAPSERTRAGLVIPQTAADAPQWGTVVAIGPDVQLDLPVDADPDHVLRVGDRVLFARYSGSELRKQDGTCYFFLAEEDLIAKLTEPEDDPNG
jgi:chaperonin GroES